MNIWIATVGLYDETRIIGVADSQEAADLLVTTAMLSSRFKHYRSDEFDVTGPFKQGKVYDWNGEVA